MQSVSSPTTAVATAVNVLAGWQGVQEGSNYGVLDYVDPPDVPLAVGPNHVFELANGLGIIWTKSGAFVKTVNPQSLFQVSATDGIGDARAIYDAPSGRWFASGADFTTGNVVLAVSTTSDPMGTWKAYSFATGKGCPDQPWMGTSSDKLVLSLNTFSACDSTFTGGMFWAINKTDLVTGATPRYQTWGPSLSFLNMVPVQAMTSTTTAYLAWPIQPNYVRVFTLTGTPPATVAVAYHDYPVSTMANAPNAVQPGTNYTLRTGDNRLRDGFWASGRLWIAYNDGCVPAGDTLTRACVRLTQLDTTNQTVLQDFDVGASNEYTFYPALRQDSSGNLVAVFGVSSASVYPSIVVAARVGTDATNTLGPWTTLWSGRGARLPTSGSCASYVCRYGDYFGAAVDPSATTTIWTAGEYGNTSGWGTYVGAVQVGASPPPPNSVTLTFSYTVIGGGSGYTAPMLTYVQGGSTKSAALSTSATSYTVDANSAWSVTNPLTGSGSNERWQTRQSTSGTATSSVTVTFSFSHQYAITFGYTVLGGGSGYSAPSVSYTTFGTNDSAATGTSVWVDAGTSYGYPVNLPGSGTSESWRTNSPSGPAQGSNSITVKYYHQWSVTFAYTILGGGSGYSSPTVSATQFGLGITVPTGSSTWIDSGASYVFGNPLGGSDASQRWISASVSDVVSAGGTITASYYHQFLVTFSFSVVGGGSGYATPLVSYVAMGTPSSAAMGTSVWADSGSACQFQNPLSGSTTTESWRTAAAGGAVSQAGSVSATYYHQFLVTFAYQVLSGGAGYSAPTVSYVSLGSSASTATGTAVWADAETTNLYPTSLPGSTSSEAWRTNAASSVAAASGTISVLYTHQFSVAFGYSVLGGGSGYTAPTVWTTQFGVSISLAAGTTAWVDAGAPYTFANPLAGSMASERWITASPTGSVTGSTTYSPGYVHQYSVSFSFSDLGGGSGYSAPTATYTSMGGSATTGMGVAVWADAGSSYGFTNPLSGSTSTAAWRTDASHGDVSAAGPITVAYYYQFLVTFLVQVVNGNPPSTMPALTATAFGATTSVVAGESNWLDANGAYSFPASFTGGIGERWMTAAPPSGTVSLSAAITASYYHQSNVTFAYSVSGGGKGYGAPSLSYVALGALGSASAGTSVWADAGSAYVYASALPGGSSQQRWVTPAPGGTVTSTGTFTVAYIHQYWADFTFTVNGGGSGYSAPSVTYANLTVSTNVSAVSLWVWADTGSTYVYQNPLPGSTSSNGWRTNNGQGTIGSSTTYSATYKHQYKVKFKATTLTGSATPEAPMINVTEFGTIVSLPSDNVSWVDAGGSYSFPGAFYGPLPGERWITSTPPSGLVLGPMNITAAYVHEYYLAIQVNAPSGGTITGTAGWYNESSSLALSATAATGWQFQGWIGSGNGSYSGASPTASLEMGSPVTETAVFYVGLTLTASTGGALQYTYGGTSGWVPAGSSETLYLVPGTNVTVTAAPSLFYQLDGWSGSAAGSPSVVTITATAPQTLSAAFGMSLYSKVDSLLGVALLLSAILMVVLALRRSRRKRKERALRAARLRARARAPTYR